MNARTAADIAVIISTYNRPRALDLVLQGYAHQTVSPSQIIIGDDGSGQDTLAIIEKWRALGLPILHCWHEDNGFRKTIVMNKAIREIVACSVIFTDGDCIPFPTFVHDHVAYAEPGFMLAGPRILGSQSYTNRLEMGTDSCERRSAWYWFLRRLTGDINRLGPIFRLPDGAWRKVSPTKWQTVRGCNFSVETRHLWAVGGFDESLQGWGYEDSDLAVRLINAGIQIKSLRYAAPLLHLWHKEESRSQESQNYHHLMETITSRRIRAVTGLANKGMVL